MTDDWTLCAKGFGVYNALRMRTGNAYVLCIRSYRIVGKFP